MKAWREGLESNSLPGLKSRELGRECLRAESLPSTNDTLWEWAKEGAPHGAVVLAQRQTAGRGRQGRSWEGPEGNLYLSLLLFPRVPLGEAGAFPLVAGLILSRWVESLSLSPRIKWPNDILLDGKKVAGILVESRTLSRSALVLGVGLNLCTPKGGWPEELAERAVALDQYGPVLAPGAVASAFLGVLEPAWENFEASGLAPFLPEIRERDALHGHSILLERAGQEVHGEAAGIGPDGSLLIKFADGRIESLHAGEVHLHRPEAMP